MTNVPKGDYVNVFKPERPPGQHVTPGVHAPGDAPYAPSNPLAWGPKGAWGPGKSAEAQNFEAQARATLSYASQDGARCAAPRRDATAALLACYASGRPRGAERARRGARARAQAS
jgi:hypothetical protein